MDDQFDFDIEMGDAADVPMEDEHQVAEILVGDDLQEDGEIEETANGDSTNESQRLVPNKVHIRGLDLLDQDKLKAYVSSHVGGKGADRIEWVNDSSANLVFSSETAAQEALLLLSAVDIADATQLPVGEVLPAKPVNDQPQIALQVRFAVESDKKERGAAQKSRFYLLNPEWDPETDEGRRRREGRNRRYRERDDRGSYRRSGRGRYDDRYDDRGEEIPESFDVNLYDDDPAALSKRATLSPRPRSRQARDRGRGRNSPTPSDRSDQDRYKPANQGKELFPNSRPRDSLRSERGSYARKRSASPLSSERYDRDAIEDDLAKDREAVRNNRDKARSIKERLTTKSTRIDSGPRELFPTTSKKELFPVKSAGGGGGAMMDQVNVLSEADGSKNNAISVRGLARQVPDHGGMLTIKGTAKSVKELFPNKFNDEGPTSSSNAGKELFADNFDGRSRNRRRAGDLFD
ncbi:hypothetical protein N0V82_000762 [Gnomoniopsis sp. IMI 355080]|nr:hypothetical protein N0V82_000762 [Gnomoniopsis sp. IMI 355080]